MDFWRKAVSVHLNAHSLVVRSKASFPYDRNDREDGITAIGAQRLLQPLRSLRPHGLKMISAIASRKRSEKQTNRDFFNYLSMADKNQIDALERLFSGSRCSAAKMTTR